MGRTICSSREVKQETCQTKMTAQLQNLQKKTISATIYGAQGRLWKYARVRLLTHRFVFLKQRIKLMRQLIRSTMFHPNVCLMNYLFCKNVQGAVILRT